MDSYTTEATITTDGTVTLDDLPFKPGNAIKITVVKQADDSEPFLSATGPHSWQNANPAYWIKIAAERIASSFHPEKIILFGSHATGTATQGSDIDLLVIFKEVTDQQAQNVSIRSLLSDFPVSKDIVVTTEREVADYGDLVGSVLRPALKNGKVIYERAK